MTAGAGAAPPPAVHSALAAAVDHARQALAGGVHEVTALAGALYGGWYCPLGPVYAGGPADSGGAAWGSGDLPYGPPDLGELLRLAHHGSRRWERGWVVTAVGLGARLTAVRAGRQRQLMPPDYINLVRPGVPPAPGEALEAPARVDWEDPAGWWVTESVEHGSPRDRALRLYWNLGAAAAADVVGALTAALDGAELAWALKCPREPDGYARRDAMVLLVPQYAWGDLAPRLRALHRDIGGALRPGVPPLTKELARGLALAEDPGDGRSFGESRCAALAGALVELRSGPGLGAPDVVEALAARLAAAGIDLANPHLRVSGPDPYQL